MPRLSRRFLLRWSTVALALALLGSFVLQRVRSPKETPVMRGLALARELGCFGCHGPDGRGAHPNPGSALGEVPPLAAGGAFAGFALDEGEIRQWILTGKPSRPVASSEEPGLIRMPAYADFLSERELDDLVAGVRHLAARPRPASAAAEQGYLAAERLGCFACHGPGGRGGLPNPGSFKGYIPPWDGADFAELVEDGDELGQWILDGEVARFRANPLAQHFLGRQAIRMPSYRGRISPEELDAIAAYVRWLRDEEREARPFEAERAGCGPHFADAVERGSWLYRRAGCVACHGPAGRGGVRNENATGDAVPALVHTAERLQLYERGDAEALIRALERGTPLHECPPDIPDFDGVLSGYLDLRDTIVRGSRPVRRAPDGPEPPLHMPPWAERAHADGGPPTSADIDALIAYLLTLEPWDS